MVVLVRIVQRGAEMNMQTAGRSNLLLSVAAVITGALVGIVLSLGTDALLRAVSVLPPLGERAGDLPLLGAVLYRTIYGVLGAYITARMAPARPMRHAMVLGFLGLAANLAGTISTWNKGPAFGPHWYPVVLIVLALPTAWLGGRLCGE
jgi:hypothetical protein